MYTEQIIVDTDEAKTHFAEISDNVYNGAVYIITKHGKPFVKIIQATGETDTLQTDGITEVLNRYYKDNPAMPDAGLRQAAYQLLRWMIGSMIRGKIWWANLPEPAGSAPEKRRPVLIIQGDRFNRSAINTVICAMITSNTALANIPGNLFLEKAVSGLDKSSVVNFSQITTLDKTDLTEFVGMLSKNALSKANAAIKMVLEIE